MTTGGGFGSRGEIEITHGDTESRVLIPWRIAIRQVVIICIGVLVIYALIWIVWITTLLCTYAPAESPRNGWALWWLTTRHVIETLWHHYSRWFMVWLAPFVLAPVLPLYRLYRHNYAPKIKHDGWPPPFAQVKLSDVGALTWENADDALTKPQVTSVEFNGSISNGDGKSLHWRLKTGAPNQWQRYARALTQPPKWLRARFSIRAARLFGVPDQEFTNLQQGWLSIGYAERTSAAANAHAKLTAWGESYMRELARTELPV